MHSQAMIRGGHTQGSLKLTHVNIRSSKKYLGSVKPNGIYFKETYWKNPKKIYTSSTRSFRTWQVIALLEPKY